MAWEAAIMLPTQVCRLVRLDGPVAVRSWIVTSAYEDVKGLIVCLLDLFCLHSRL